MAVFLTRRNLDVKAPTNGILVSDLEVGSSVFLKELGTPVEYLVVHYGTPSSVYDSSCDGLWLLRKDIYQNMVFNSQSSQTYPSSSIHSYLNGTFFGMFDPDVQAVIKQVKIPYAAWGTSSQSTGSKGLSTTIFLLSGTELGEDSSGDAFQNEGARLSYFSSVAALTNYSSKRVAYLNGIASAWWTRTPSNLYTSQSLSINRNGGPNGANCTDSLGVRPAFVLSSNVLFDSETKEFMGVA